ncbi:MAG: molybdate ABC transporter permease subunit [Vicinamibacterales bacterium]
MTADTWAIARFTVLMAATAILLALPPAVGIGWLLARRSFPGKALLETIVSLPLVLPPVATGLFLLWLFGRRSPVGRALDAIGLEVVFTPKAVVIAMIVISFPLIARSVRAGIEQVDRRFERIAETLGAGTLRILATITLPLASRSIVAGAILGFSRALGEFGATIMVAGAIPGRTQTLAVGIYTFVETGRENDAWALLVVSSVLAFGAIFLSNRLAHAHDDDSTLGGSMRTSRNLPEPS